MSKAGDSSSTEKKGNITLFAADQIYENLANNFLDHRKFGRDEIVYFNLAVPTDRVATAYSKGIPPKKEYDEIPKYYKDDATGEIKSYDNGRELREV
jgi:hypothetical protein